MIMCRSPLYMSACAFLLLVQVGCHPQHLPWCGLVEKPTGTKTSNIGSEDTKSARVNLRGISLGEGRSKNIDIKLGASVW